MSKRLTVLYVDKLSEEFALIKKQVREQYYDDLFPKRLREGSVTLIETMGEDRYVVGFTIDNPSITSSRTTHGYSLITHEITHNRSKAQAIKWVKDQFKKGEK